MLAIINFSRQQFKAAQNRTTQLSYKQGTHTNPHASLHPSQLRLIHCDDLGIRDSL